MKDLQVKDFENCLTTQQPIKFHRLDTNEEFTVSIGKFNDYGNWYVTKIFAVGGSLVLDIISEI